MAAAARVDSLCGTCLTVLKPGNRRNLDHGSCAAVLSTLSALVDETCPQLAAVVRYGSGGKICKPCYRSIERLSNLRTEISTLEAKVCDNLKKRAELVGGTSQNQSETVAPSPRKRSRESYFLNTPPRVCRRDLPFHSPLSRKRARIDTPTRQAVLSLQPSSDSPVSSLKY